MVSNISFPILVVSLGIRFIFLILGKSRALEVLKIYKIEVENQLEKKLKIIISNCRGKYYGR